MADPSPEFLLDAARSCLLSCRLEGPAGSYRRTPKEDAEASPAACAAATNIRYMLGTLPGEGTERKEWLETLRSFQDRESGLFDQGAHALPISAACTAALSLFQAAPLSPPLDHLTYCDPEALRSFLQERCWCEEPERSAREAAALYTILHGQEQAGTEWAAQFHEWLYSEVDTHTGLIRKGCIAPIELEGSWTLLPYLCAVMYPVAVAQHARQPLCIPWRLVDTALEVMEFHRDLFFKRKGHRHFPWVYTLSRCMRTTTHRHEEARQALERFVPAYLSYLREQIDGNRYHRLTQVQWDLATLAELQLAVPGTLRGIPPLRQVLDAAPFL